MTDNPLGHTTEKNFSRLISMAWLLLPCALAVVGSVGLAASWIPYRILAAKVRAISLSGQATFFTTEFLRAIQLRLRLIGLANVLLAAVALPFRRLICRIGGQVRADFSRLAADAKSGAASIPVIDRLGLLLLMAIAGWLRFALLFQPMRGDEAYSFTEYASHPFYVGLSFYNFPNNHLFQTFLMRCTYLVFGSHPWALRLPVFVAGLCLVPATYMASRCLYKTESGLLAAGLVASSSMLIGYSTNARGYILVSLVVAILICVAAHALRNDNWASWLLAGTLTVIGFYAIPIMLYPFGGIVLWVVLCSLWPDAGTDLRGVVRGVSFAALVGGIGTFELYSPVFAVSGPSAVLSNKWVRGVPLPVFVHNLPLSLASTWKQWNWDVPFILVWVLGAGFVAALVFHRDCGRQHVAIPVAMVACALPLVVLQKVVPFERVWLFALPVYFIVACAGVVLGLTLVRARSRYAVGLIAIAIALIVGMRGRRSQSVYLSNEGRGFEQLAIYLKSELKPGDSVIAVMSSEAPLRYYFQQYHVPSSYLNAPGGREVLVVMNQVSEDNMQTLFDYAKRPDLDVQTAKFMREFDSLQLYEVLKR
jgi:hypothetical protein